jgi:outer membrane protein assembly factor BamB
MNRRSLCVLAALVACQLGGSLSASAEGGADWYRFLGPNLNAKSDEVGIRTDWSDDKLPIVWQREVGEGYSMPSVAAGRMFIFDRQGDKARLTCVDSLTGKELWRSEYPTAYKDHYGYSGGPRASPVVDGDRVYSFGVEGRLRAHRVTGGELIWEVDTTKDFGVVQNFFGAGSTPIIEGDLLIAMVGGSPPDPPSLWSGELRGDGSGIVAFDKMTGNVIYKSSDELASYSSPVITSIGDRRWGFVFARGGLVGFEPATGKIDFHFPWRSKKIESVNAATPVVVGDRILITEAYTLGSALLQVRPGEYELIRKDPPRRGQSMASHWSTPIYHEGFLYGCSGEKSGAADLRCVDFTTGEIKWSQSLGSRLSLLYVDGYLVVQTERGGLALVRANPERAELVTRLTIADELGYPTWNAPILSHGIMYVRGSKGLMAFELIPNR